MSKSAQNFGLMAFVFVLSDSMVTYFLRPFLGAKEVSTNFLLPIFVLAVIVIWGIKVISVSGHVRFALVMGYTGFLVGVVILPDFNIYRVGTILSGLSAFFIGYFSSKWTDNVDMYARAFIFVGGLYVCICLLAIHESFPSLFPVIKRPGNYMGTLIVRPEITTDQNFQFFYLLPVVLCLALPFRLVRFLACFGGLVGALYIMNCLQTRSGFLILTGASVLCLFAPLFSRGLGRKKTIILPLLIAVLVFINLALILQIGEPIIARFFDRDYNTFYGRISAFTYLLEHISNPMWWVPMGNSHFKAMAGGQLPHCTPTAIFLEAGILGLYMWIVVFFVPLIYLTRMLLKGELDALATVILVGGISCFIGQLSLNAPLHEHVWLWAGAVLGTLARVRHAFSDREKNEKLLKEWEDPSE